MAIDGPSGFPWKKIPYTIFIINPDGTLLSEGEPSGLSV